MAKEKEAPAEETSEPQETTETEKTPETEKTEETAKPEAPQEPTAEELLKAEKDKYLRLAAEYDNYRKRSQKEREAIYRDVKADTVAKLLPVYDNLERALRQGSTDEAFMKGIEMTMNQLTEIFEGLGVKPIEAVGQKFDANKHNAVMHVEDESLGENEIAQEFQKGFTLGDKVIRFSVVQVAN